MFFLSYDISDNIISSLNIMETLFSGDLIVGKTTLMRCDRSKEAYRKLEAMD